MLRYQSVTEISAVQSSLINEEDSIIFLEEVIVFPIKKRVIVLDDRSDSSDDSIEAFSSSKRKNFVQDDD